MKQKKVLIPLVIILIIVGVYVYPGPHLSFKEIYQKVDPQTTESLLAFRKNYPPAQINQDGFQWDYLVTGQGQQTILFLHGMTGSYDIWWQPILDLQKDFNIISVTYPPVHSLQELASGVLKIMENAGVEKVLVVGSSLGGYFTQFLVARYPEKIEKAVFANTFPPNDIIAAKNRVSGKLLPYLPEWVVMTFLRSSTENSVYPAAEHSELVRAFILEQSYGKMTKEQFEARYHCVIDSFQAPDSEKLGIPVMIIEADNDPLVEPELRAMLRATYQTATIKTLHNKGHFAYLNEPQLYVSLLREFFSGSSN